MGKYYKLSEFSDKEFYMCIIGARNFGYNYSFKTSLDGLTIGDLDDYTYNLYTELEDVRNGDLTYAEVGFLHFHGINIDSLNVLTTIDFKKYTQRTLRVIFYSDSVYLDGEMEDLKIIMRQFGFSPDNWIGEEITV